MRDKTQINPIRGGFFKFCRIYIRDEFLRGSGYVEGGGVVKELGCICEEMKVLNIVAQF